MSAFTQILAAYTRATTNVRENTDKPHSINVAKYTKATLLLRLDEAITQNKEPSEIHTMVFDLVQKGIITESTDSPTFTNHIKGLIREARITDQESNCTLNGDGGTLNLRNQYIKVVTGEIKDAKYEVTLWRLHKEHMENLARQKEIDAMASKMPPLTFGRDS